MKELSQKQRKILGFIEEFIDEHDYPPSIRQIQEACQISSTSVVDYNLRNLEKDGYIARDPENARGIRVLRGPDHVHRPRAVAVPIIGTIAAGEPIAVPSADTWGYETADTIAVDRERLGSRESVFALRVKGDSMIEDNVEDGDIVVMQPAQTARDGEMVAAWLEREQETTLKRIYLEGGRVRLQPANTRMAPIYTDADNVRVQGKVIEVRRSYPTPVPSA